MMEIIEIYTSPPPDLMAEQNVSGDLGILITITFKEPLLNSV